MAIAFGLANLAGLGVIAYSLCPVANEKMYSSLLFAPQNMSPAFNQFAYFGLKEPEPVSFKSSDGVKLTGWFFKSAQEKRVVMISHGQAGDMTFMLAFVKPMLDLDTSVLLYNYRGYADSEGEPTVAGICMDGVAAFDYLVNDRHTDPHKIVAMGVSLGTGVACNVIKLRHPGGVILQSGYTSLKQAADERLSFLSWVPQFLYPQNALDNAAILREIKTPLLVVHGSLDQCFPLHHATDLYASASGPRHIAIFDGVDHNHIPGDHLPQYKEALDTFFSSLD